MEGLPVIEGLTKMDTTDDTKKILQDLVAFNSSFEKYISSCKSSNNKNTQKCTDMKKSLEENADTILKETSALNNKLKKKNPTESGGKKKSAKSGGKKNPTKSGGKKKSAKSGGKKNPTKSGGKKNKKMNEQLSNIRDEVDEKINKLSETQTAIKEDEDKQLASALYIKVAISVVGGCALYYLFFHLDK
jgi:hypothetical protein